jgi:hypothetical protein
MSTTVVSSIYIIMYSNFDVILICFIYFKYNLFTSMQCPELIKITYQTNYVSLGRVKNNVLQHALACVCACVDYISSVPNLV